MNIFITGATGQLGTYVIDYLKQFAPQAQLFGLARSTQAAQRLAKKGVIARRGDYAEPASLVAALTGMDRLLFISVPQAELQANVVAAAQQAHVGFIAYTSINGIAYPKVGLEQNHRQTEALITATGIPHTFLRNSWYLEMEINPFKAALATGVYDTLSQGKVSYATRQEYAEAAARVIAHPQFGAVVELGRNAFTHRELAHALATATGQSLSVQQVDAATYQAWLAPYTATNFETAMQAYVQHGDNGEAAVTQTTFETVLGHPLKSLVDAIHTIL